MGEYQKVKKMIDMEKFDKNDGRSYQINFDKTINNEEDLVKKKSFLDQKYLEPSSI